MSPSASLPLQRLPPDGRVSPFHGGKTGSIPLGRTRLFNDLTRWRTLGPDKKDPKSNRAVQIKYWITPYAFGLPPAPISGGVFGHVDGPRRFPYRDWMGRRRLRAYYAEPLPIPLHYKAGGMGRRAAQPPSGFKRSAAFPVARTGGCLPRPTFGLNGRPHLLRHELHDCLGQPFERREGVQHDAVGGRGADDALAVDVERAFLVEPGEVLWRCLRPSSQGARGTLKSARFL